MLKPIDRCRRDGPLYPGSTKTLRDFIDPKHLLVRIDANFDFAALTEFAEKLYDPWVGRPAVHPEVVIRALILSSVYNVTSYRQLCERIAENLAWRWFCHLALEDPVFDHSTLSVFLERLGAEGFRELLQRLNTHLADLGLVSPRTYADSSLVSANANTTGLDPTDLSPAEFAQQAKEQENGTFRVTERVPAVPEEGRPARVLFHHYQDAQGRLPLSPVDPDARWRRQSKWRPAIFGYKEHLIADKSGFILARRVTPADAGDADEALPLLDRLPIRPKSLGADAGYRAGRFRHALRRRGITPFIPITSSQGGALPEEAVDPNFTYHGDHVTCRQGKRLKMASFPNHEGGVQFVALQADCQACPVRTACLTPNEKRRYVQVSRYEFEFRRARRLNATAQYRREMQRRKTVVEGVFARLDHLGWDEARFRGLEKVDRQGSIAAVGHNILKALTKRRFRKRAACAKRPEFPSSATHAPVSLKRLRCLPLSPSSPPLR